MKKIVVMLGRVCLSLIFVASALGKLFSWADTTAYVAKMATLWQDSSSISVIFNNGLAWIASHPGPAVMGSVLLEGVGGILVLLGIKIRFGSALLMIFVITATLIMHPFWMMAGEAKMMQMAMFMKNVSILGGLIILAAKEG